MMKQLLIVITILLSTSIWAEDMYYDQYNLIQTNLDTAEKFNSEFTDMGFYSLVDAAHGIPSLGINQVFFKNEHQFVMVKHGIDGKFPVNEFIHTPNGILYHLEINNKFVMVYFRGHNIESAKHIIFRLKDQTASSTIKKVTNALIPSAHAGCEVATGKSILGENGKTVSAISSSMAWEMVKSCMTGLGEGVWDSTGGTIMSIGKEIAAFAKHPIDYSENVANKVELFLVKTGQFIKTLVTDPDQAFAQVGKGLGSAWNTVKNSVATMSTAMKVNFVCSLIGSLGVDVALTFLTGGAASAKVALTIERLASKFGKMKKLLTVMSKLSVTTLDKLKLGNAKIEKFMKGLMSGKYSDADIAHLNAMAKHSDEFSLRTLSCFIR